MICPKCKRKFFGRPALSRVDNKTLICDECGTNEALEAYIAHLQKVKAEPEDQEND